MKKQRKHWERGVSLLEIVIVVGLLAIVVAIAAPAFYTMYQRYRAETAVERITMNLRFARIAAIKKRIKYKVVFDAANDSYQVQMNPAKDDSTWVVYSNADTSMPDSGLDILTGGITEVEFNPRGVAGTSGNIRIQSTDFIYRINVFTTGAVTKVAE